MTSHRRAGIISLTAFIGCMACGGISSNSPDDMVGGTGSGAAPAASGGNPSSGGDGSGARGSGGSPVLPDDCAPFAEWDPALRAAVQEATGSELPEPDAWAELNVLRVEGGSSAVGAACLVGLQVFEWNNASAPFTASALGKLTKLTSARFARTEVDLSYVQNAGNWRQLTLIDSLSTDLRAVANFAALERLTLNGTSAPDLADLVAMTALFHLSLDGVSVSDLGPLAFHPALRIVSLNETGVTNLAALASIPHLESVSVLGNTLDAESLNTHIPALLAADVCVAWEDPPGTVHREPAICFDPK